VVGERIRLGDEEFLTVKEVDLDVPGGDVIGPGDGMKWVAALVEIEGIDPAGATYNRLYFSLTDDEGFGHNASVFGKEPALDSSNDLAPGATVEGWVTFEVSMTATSYVMRYRAGFLGDAVEIAFH
jgi:hypothetical protein